MTTWKEILDDVLSDRRQAMGEEPSFQTLIDFRKGQLSPV